jgi:pimeloyl-ACP methyl ester carboxylesterase
MHKTIEAIDGGRNLKKTLVGHDWGALFTYMFDSKYKNYVSEIVGLDVSPYISKFKLSQGILMMAYQSINLILFFFSLLPILGIISDLLTMMIIRYKWKYNPKYLKEI